MKLYEYKAKEVFAKHGIPIPFGVVVRSPEELKEFKFPAAVKSQVLIGGRGKAGGIKFANDLEEAKEKVNEIIGMDIRGYKVKTVLIEEKLNITKEYYLGITIDRGAGAPLLIASAEGGVEIESVPEEKLYKKHINPFIGIQPFILRDLNERLGLDKEQGKKMAKIVKGLYDVFDKEDAELAEINPLVSVEGGDFIAADGKLTIDNDALFRHPEYKDLDQDLTPLEQKAKEKDIAFIQLDGNIGVIANGAGLTMATLDNINLHGGKAGVFLDLGGTDNPEKVKEAFNLMKEAMPKVILLNIFGGITKCDTVARGVMEALEVEKIDIPVVARIKGRNEEEARHILKDAGLVAAKSLEEAASKAAELSGGGA